MNVHSNQSLHRRFSRVIASGKTSLGFPEISCLSHSGHLQTLRSAPQHRCAVSRSRPPIPRPRQPRLLSLQNKHTLPFCPHSWTGSLLWVNHLFLNLLLSRERKSRDWILFFDQYKNLLLMMRNIILDKGLYIKPIDSRLLFFSMYNGWHTASYPAPSDFSTRRRRYRPVSNIV